MHIFIALLELAILLFVLLDAFETILLPRRISRTHRITTFFYRISWLPWARISRLIRSGTRREAFLAYFGPLSLLFLLVIWAFGLICGFALLQYGVGEHVQLAGEKIGIATLLYLSGSTFFTLGFGDVTPVSGLARVLSVVEAGMGFAFLGVVVGYLPVIYSSFSKREVQISLLDARAGSPPTAVELLRRFGACPQGAVLDAILRDWEHWAAEVLESHISYPVLCTFRSQHANQSWLAALTTILDATALILVGIEAVPMAGQEVDGQTCKQTPIRPEQAKLTFAMARHAVVDLAQVIGVQYRTDIPERLAPDGFVVLQQSLAQIGLRLASTPEAEQKLTKLRSLYESYIQSLGARLLMDLPPWMSTVTRKDNWQGGPWDARIQAQAPATGRSAGYDHF